MCVKLRPGDLNPDPYLPHPTNIYICGITTIPKVHGNVTDCALNLIYNVKFQFHGIIKSKLFVHMKCKWILILIKKGRWSCVKSRSMRIIL